MSESLSNQEMAEKKSAGISNKLRAVLIWSGIIVLFVGFWVTVYCSKFVPAENPTSNQILNYAPSARRTVIVREIQKELECNQAAAEALYDYLQTINIGKIAAVSETYPEGNGSRAVLIVTEDSQYVADLRDDLAVLGVIDITPLDN